MSRLSHLFWWGVFVVSILIAGVVTSQLYVSLTRARASAPHIICDSGSWPDPYWTDEDYATKARNEAECDTLMASFHVESAGARKNEILIAPVRHSATTTKKVEHVKNGSTSVTAYAGSGSRGGCVPGGGCGGASGSTWGGGSSGGDAGGMSVCFDSTTYKVVPCMSDAGYEKLPSGKYVQVYDKKPVEEVTIY